MDDRVEHGSPGAIVRSGGRSGLRSSLLTSGRTRSVLAAVPRLLLLVVIVWALTGPIDRIPSLVDAAGLSAGAPAGSPLSGLR